jgi:hypothetical protein
MKMYILIKESIPEGFAILAAAHVSLAAYLKFKDSLEINEWLSGPFPAKNRQRHFDFIDFTGSHFY